MDKSKAEDSSAGVREWPMQADYMEDVLTTCDRIGFEDDDVRWLRDSPKLEFVILLVEKPTPMCLQHSPAWQCTPQRAMPESEMPALLGSCACARLPVNGTQRR